MQSFFNDFYFNYINVDTEFNSRFKTSNFSLFFQSLLLLLFKTPHIIVSFLFECGRQVEINDFFYIYIYIYVFEIKIE